MLVVSDDKQYVKEKVLFFNYHYELLQALSEYQKYVMNVTPYSSSISCTCIVYSIPLHIARVLIGSCRC